MMRTTHWNISQDDLFEHLVVTMEIHCSSLKIIALNKESMILSSRFLYLAPLKLSSFSKSIILGSSVILYNLA